MTTARQLHAGWRALPFGTLQDVIGRGTALILAPHPDDESLGCGGLIARCCAEATPPLVAVLTDGSASHPGSMQFPPAKLAARREQEVATAIRLLGMEPDRLIFLHQPDGKAPQDGPEFTDVVARLCQLVRAHRVTALLAPWRYDPHGDHVAAALVAAEVARVTGVPLRSYPVWGWMLPDDAAIPAGASGGWRIDITAYQKVRRQAIGAHASQYGALITDDPQGFTLPGELLHALDQPWETFLKP